MFILTYTTAQISIPLLEKSPFVVCIFRYNMCDSVFLACTHCGDAASVGVHLLACSRCRSVAYCSATCQRADWKRRHKAACKISVETTYTSPSLASTSARFPASSHESVWAAVDCVSLPRLCTALSNGGSPNEICEGAPALHLALSKGNIEIVRALLVAGAGTDAVDDVDGFTAIHVAIHCGVEMVRALLSDPRTNVNALNRKGVTAMHHVAKEGKVALARVLVGDARFSLTAGGGAMRMSPLHVAAHLGHSSVVDVFVCDARCDLSVTNAEGETALHLAAREGHVHVVRALMRDPRLLCSIAARSGLSPLHIAAGLGHAAVVRILLADKRVDVNAAQRVSITLGDHPWPPPPLTSAPARLPPFRWDDWQGPSWTAVGVARKGGHTAVVQLLEADPRVSW